LPEGFERISTLVIFHVLTIFPEFFSGPFLRRREARRRCGHPRNSHTQSKDWTHDRHKTVDDRPFGGGEGMVLKPEPLFDAVETIWPERSEGQRVALLSAQGRMFDQAMANQLAQDRELLLICGRYEGVDERVAEHLADEEISIGNYVLSGGELAACRGDRFGGAAAAGVLGNESSATFESFQNRGTGLECWIAPLDQACGFRGWKAPQVLLDGNHEEIRRFRKKTALEKTERLRPDLLK